MKGDSCQISTVWGMSSLLTISPRDSCYTLLDAPYYDIFFTPFFFLKDGFYFLEFLVYSETEGKGQRFSTTLPPSHMASPILTSLSGTFLQWMSLHWHIIFPQSPVFLRAHAWCWKNYGCGQMYNDISSMAAQSIYTVPESLWWPF